MPNPSTLAAEEAFDLETVRAFVSSLGAVPVDDELGRAVGHLLACCGEIARLRAEVERLQAAMPLGWSVDSARIPVAGPEPWATVARETIDSLRAEVAQAEADLEQVGRYLTLAREDYDTAHALAEQRGAVLRELEWSARDDRSRVCCPDCHGAMPTHLGGCALAAALKEPE